MAGILFVAQTAEVATTTDKTTVLQIVAAANHRVLVHEISIGFKGTTNTDAPILVQVLRQSDAGTGGDALTLAKADESADETLQSTALKDIDDAEPTGATAVMTEEVHPQGGYTWQAPFGRPILVKGGTRLGIAVTAGVTVSCVARMVCEE
jgi:hypothetical protein